MKKLLLIVLAVAIMAGIAVFFYLRQKPAPKAADLLPDSTLLFVAVPDFPKARQDFCRTPLYAFWQEPEVQAFVEQPTAALRELLGLSRSESALDKAGEDQVLGVLQGEVFVAATHVTAIPALQIGVVLGADVKQKRLQAVAFLKYLEHNMAHRFPGSTAADKRYLGTSYSVWQLQQNVQLCHAFLNSLLVFTFDENSMRDVITRFAGQAPSDSRPLSASPVFKSMLQKMPPRHDGVAFLNFEQLAGIFGPLLAVAPQSGGMFQKLAGLQASAATMTFGDNLVEDVSLVAFKGTNHTPKAAVERRTLAFTAPDTALYTVRSVDLAASYRLTMDSLAMSGQAVVTAPAVQFDRALAKRGVRFADDVLAQTGPELATLGVWREGARFPDLALITEIRNRAQIAPKLDAAMDALKDAITGVRQPLAWEAQPYLGETFRTLRSGAGILSPTYVVTDKFLILASTADYARALVAQLKNTGPTLAGNAAYVEAMKRLPIGGCSYTYCDLRSVFTALFAVARANLDAAGAKDYVDLSKLPKTETFTKHLAPFASATVDTDSQEMTTTFSPLGKPVTLVCGAAGVLGAVQPWLSQLPPGLIPSWPTTSSSSPPAKSQTAPSQTPTSR